MVKNVYFRLIKRFLFLSLLGMLAATPTQAAGEFSALAVANECELDELGREIRRVFAAQEELFPSAPKRYRASAESITMSEPLPASKPAPVVLMLPPPVVGEERVAASSRNDERTGAEAAVRRPPASSPGVAGEEDAPSFLPMTSHDAWLPRHCFAPKGFEISGMMLDDIPAIKELAQFTIRNYFNPLICKLNKTEGLALKQISSRVIDEIDGYNIALLPLHECLVARDAMTGAFQGFIVVRPEWTAPLTEEQKELFTRYEQILKKRPMSTIEGDMLCAVLPVNCNEVHIELLEVAPDPTGSRKGLGTALMKSVFYSCLRGHSEDEEPLIFSLDVLANNEPAINLYKKLGFTEDVVRNETWRLRGYLRMVATADTLRHHLIDK